MEKDDIVKYLKEFIKMHYDEDGEFKAEEIEYEINLKLGRKMTYNIADFAVKKPENKNITNYGEYLEHGKQKGYYKIKK